MLSVLSMVEIIYLISLVLSFMLQGKLTTLSVVHENGRSELLIGYNIIVSGLWVCVHEYTL